MEVVVPPPPPQLDLNFDSAYSSPYTTAPSSPQRLNSFFYFSAPTSPNRASSFHKEFNDISLSSGHPFPPSSIIPFDWEEKPGTPKTKVIDKDREDNVEEFEFDFSGQLDRASLSAEELFDKGKIRPLKPPPGYDFFSQSSSPRSPSSRALLNMRKDFDPFQAALEETRKREAEVPVVRQERGRTSSSARKKGSSRSLSPLRVSDIVVFEPEESISNSSDPHKIRSSTTSSSSSKTSYASSIFSALSFPSKGYRKWKLKDLLLFRSASEGRPSGSSGSSIVHGGSRENSLGKYAVLSKKEVIEDVKNSSSRSTEGSVGGTSQRRLSSAEVHYTVNRAVAEEMRRKTPLAYKRGLLGCLGFNHLNNPGVHDLSRGIGSLTRGR